MYKSKVLVGCVLLIYILFVVFEFNGNNMAAFTLDFLITPVIALLYLFFARKKDVFFSLFMLFYSLSDFIGAIISYFFDKKDSNVLGMPLSDFDYLIGNGLFILAYLFLIIKIIKSLNIFYVLRNFKIHLIVLTILNIYLVYVLQVILAPSLNLIRDYYLEITYNIIMLVLLSVALLNYFYRDNKKSLYLFIGALCIVFSEVMQVAYFYIAERSLLNFLSTTLTLIAFYFFYQQTSLIDESSEEEKYMVIE